jgi:hypothetical protein
MLVLHKYNAHHTIKFPMVLNIENIVLDSLYIDDPRKDIEVVDSFIRANIELSLNNKPNRFYNYIVDREGDIHEAVPIGLDTNYYGTNGNVILPKGYITIATLSLHNSIGKDYGYMTSFCVKSLYNLIINIILRLKQDTGVKLDGYCLSPRNYRVYTCEEDYIGHIFFKNNPGYFQALQRNITHGLIDLSIIPSKDMIQYTSLTSLINTTK